MQLNPSEISELLKQRIEGLGVSADLRTQGTVVSVTDGICRVHGLHDVMQGEMLEFPGNTYGLALNLERDSVGAVILGNYEHFSYRVSSFPAISSFSLFNSMSFATSEKTLSSQRSPSISPSLVSSLWISSSTFFKSF